MELLALWVHRQPLISLYFIKIFAYFFGFSTTFSGRVMSWETDAHSAWILIVLGLDLLASCVKPRSEKVLLETRASE